MIKCFGQLTVVLLLACCGVATSMAQNGRSLSLEECISIALDSNSDFRTATYGVDQAGANVLGSYSNVLPQITASFSSSRSTVGATSRLNVSPVLDFREVEDTSGESFTLPVQRIDEQGQQVFERSIQSSPSETFNDYALTLQYNHTLFDFGRSINTIKQAKSSYEASSQSLTSARQSVYSTVTQRYLELLKAVKLEQEFSEAVERSKEQLDRTRSMYEIGSVAQIDVYRQEVTLGTDEINLINQENIVEIARGNLNVAMGREPDTPIAVTDIDINPSLPSLSLEEAIAVAEEANPELQRFEYEMRSANYGKKVAMGRFLPSIGVNILYQRDNDQLNRVIGEFDRHFFFRFGARFDLNIFNGFADRAELNRQRAAHSIARENWLNQQRNLNLEVKRAYLNLEAFNRIATINERNLRAAGEDFRLAQERYRVGAGTSLEVTEAQVSLTRARVSLVSAKYDALIAKAQLQAAMGTIEKDFATGL